MENPKAKIGDTKEVLQREEVKQLMLLLFFFLKIIELNYEELSKNKEVLPW